MVLLECLRVNDNFKIPDQVEGNCESAVDTHFLPDL